MNRLEMCVEVLRESKQPMHIRDIAEAVAQKYNLTESLNDLELFHKKIGQSITQHIKNKKKGALIAPYSSGTGGKKRGYYKIKQKVQRARRTPLPVVTTLYTGKAGEYGLLSELLFRGFNASIMTVDTGIDVVASKNNKYFHIQVKTSNVGTANNRYSFTIKASSFRANDESSTFYALITRRYINNLWRSDYILIPSHDIGRYIAIGVITEGENFSLSVGIENGAFMLNRKESLQYQLNNFDQLR